MYGDQDEEERRIKMEILASAGTAKEVKVKAGKKGKQQQGKKVGFNLPPPSKQQPKGIPVGRLTREQLIVETPTMDAQSSELLEDKVKTDEGGEEAGEVDDDGADEDQAQGMQVDSILDSLTGQPVPDDLLMFCLPVCAPYAALNSYKYKIKLIPGSTKRGKASKLAVNMFITDKTTSGREKDLFKSLKDTDLSRNMPGKVKVSSTVHKTKKS